MSELITRYSVLESCPEWGTRWRIGAIDSNGEWIMSLDFGPQEYDLHFASEADAQRAIKELEQAGITTGEQLLLTPDSEIRRIAYRDLAW